MKGIIHRSALMFLVIGCATTTSPVAPPPASNELLGRMVVSYMESIAAILTDPAQHNFLAAEDDHTVCHFCRHPADEHRDAPIFVCLRGCDLQDGAGTTPGVECGCACVIALAPETQTWERMRTECTACVNAGCRDDDAG